ncbi:hypothetical protein [Lentibacillus sp. CBA3610]|uniref:hypothetical protein n=1 Tax=Lentibacillus sp. CBA3610 TaxID=2518176 RepID=UPI001C3EEE41|nr:hypothetical protein [Lentibacillus sp. CBA3610]
MTNETMGAIAALELYRNKDVVEKAFGNLKERLNMRRTLVSSEQSLDGKLFCGVCGLSFYLSYIKKQMQDTILLKIYVYRACWINWDVIEYFEAPGKEPRIGELLSKQKEIYGKLGVTPPTSL